MSNYTGDGIHNEYTTENATKISSLQQEAWDKYYKTKKEVKKVSRPFFEMEVVKVKKEVKCRHKIIKCTCQLCGETLITGKIKAKKGNWVNGECIDKIKFPVPCSYIHETKKMGILFKLGNSFYVVNIDEQGNYNKYFLSYDLKHLIEDFNIHILKGKIIIFEEEEK